MYIYHTPESFTGRPAPIYLFGPRDDEDDDYDDDMEPDTGTERDHCDPPNEIEPDVNTEPEDDDYCPDCERHGYCVCDTK